MSMYGDLFDICANKHGGNPESKAAFEASDIVGNHQRVRAYLLTHDGSSSEIADALRMPYTTVSATMSQAKKDGFLQPTEKRPTKYGRMAQCFRWIRPGETPWFPPKKDKDPDQEEE